ncbi:MAG: inositol-3-phosphate synthase [Actinomycetota bacterium]
MVEGRKISTPSGRLGVLMPGMGAVATTFIAGVELVKKGLAEPVGSLTQMAALSPKSPQESPPKIREIVPLYELKDLVFGGWDAFPDDAYEAAVAARVLDKSHLNAVREELKTISPMPALFEERCVRKLSARHTKSYGSLMEGAEQVRQDIRAFKREHALENVVMINCASTEVYIEYEREAHCTLEGFERALERSAPSISPAMIYAYAAIQEGVAYANGAPSVAAEVPALAQLAKERGVPVAGKDFKTGQTLLKTILAPGLRARMLGIEGWFSTNILGNRDGEVLDDAGSLKSKELSKLSVLGGILRPDHYPELYGEVHHLVKIHYYPPRGDAKEGWDNIDIFGWLGYPMQIKINLLARDSILAAPIVLDLALFLDLSRRAGMGGVQEWLSFYFKSPMSAEGCLPEHDLFVQLANLESALRLIAGRVR